MPTFAKISGGKANNVVICANQAAVAQCFHPDWLAAQGGTMAWTQVPDGTRHGATDNGNGTFTNPAVATTPPTISKTAFMDICETAFGGGATGRQRFGNIIAACAASNDGEVRFVYERYQGASTFDKSKVTALMSLLISKGTNLITPQVSSDERTAVNNLWPSA